MSDKKALRLRQDHDLPVSLDGFDPAGGFTLEAWVRPARLDDCARLFAKSFYSGPPVRLRPGAVESLPTDRLPRLGSVDLPEGIEAVFFAKERFRGAAWAIRGDHAEVLPAHATARSVVIVDQRHRRQNCVVLFKGERYSGAARLLRVGASFVRAGKEPEKVGSAWVPPGVALELTGPLDQKSDPHTLVTLHGDRPVMPKGYRRISARREAAAEGDRPFFLSDRTRQAVSQVNWPTSPRDFSGVHIPDGQALLLCAGERYTGAYAVLVGSRTDLSDLGFAPQSAAALEAPDGTDGVVAFGDWEATNPGRPLGGRIFPPGQHGTAGEYRQHLLVPDGYRVRLGDNDTGRILGPGLEDADLSGPFTVERFAGVLTAGGEGLALRRSSGLLRGGGDALDFAGRRVHSDRWHHVAMTWDGRTLRHVLDGKEVASTEAPDLGQRLSGTEWRIGVGLRGSVAQVRAWSEARSIADLRDQRFPGASGATGFIEVLDPDEIAAPPDAVSVTAALPSSPTESALYLGMHAKVQTEREQALDAANARAAALKQGAAARAAASIAAARDEARRHAHFAGLQSVAFVRGNDVVRAVWSGEDSTFVGAAVEDGADRPVPTDTAWSLGENNTPDRKWLYIATSWPEKRILRRRPDGSEEVVKELAKAPLALGVDGKGRTGAPTLVWIEAGGVLSCATISGAGAGNPFLSTQLPRGRPRTWDLAVDTAGERSRLLWSNGWEVFTANVSGEALHNVRVLVPHSASPFPIAVAVDREGTVLWLDAEDGVVRALRPGGAVEDLYAAPEPARGLAVGLIQERTDSDAADFVYWSSAEERTLEAAVLQAPGRYIDLHYDEEKPYGQQIAAVSVVHVIGRGWEAVAFARPLHRGWPEPDHSLRAGPFDTQRGIRLTARIKLDDAGTILTIEGGDSQTVGNRAYLHSDGTMKWASGSPRLTGELPRGRWFNLEILLKEDPDWLLRVWIDGDDVGGVTTNWGWPQPFWQVAFQFPGSLDWDKANNEPESALGCIASLHVTDAADERENLAHWTLTDTSEVVELSDDARVEVPADGEAGLAHGHSLRFDDAEDAVVFEPVRLDLGHGWTASADLTWRGPSADRAPQSVYELATAEDEERLVCAIDADGEPCLHLRWAGRLLESTELRNEEYRYDQWERQNVGHRLWQDKPARVTWALSPNGHLTTWINGEVVTESRVILPAEPRLFTGHRLGAPNPAQRHVRVRGALLHDDDALTRYSGFVGTIERFAAWNQYTPHAADGFDQTPGPDPTWERSLITTRSRHRYLQAGRVDGSEPPLALFPVDLDSGLALETALQSAHAQLTAAHAQAQAAEANATAVNAAALTAARAEVAEARAALASAQQKAAKDVEAAREDAATEQAAADRRKADAAVRAQQIRSEGASRAEAVREGAKRQASDRELRAAERKQAKVAAAQRRLDAQRRERDGKRQEYENRRK